MWSQRFDDRLFEWRRVRKQASKLNLKEALLHVDKWWQQAPLANHYLHITDYENWPNPWTLLADDIYCDLAKCLGIVYTLMLVEHEDIDSICILETSDFYIVEINNHYILNYYPNEIVNRNKVKNDLKVIRSVDSVSLYID